MATGSRQEDDLVATLMVLGGGGALGAYQAGVLLALAESGVFPDALFGCSAGALNAAFWAQQPTLERAAELTRWWQGPTARDLLAPTLRRKVQSLAGAVRAGGTALLDAGALRSVVTSHVSCHDLGGLAVPLTVTTTCLDCSVAVHHDRGPVLELLTASCALPGLLPPVRLPDGHLHVDGGIVCGVPLDAAMAVAGPTDQVLVLDCSLAPVTCGASCAAAGPARHGPVPQRGAHGSGCALPVAEPRSYLAPTERVPRALDPVLRAFTAARNVASQATVRPFLSDPRVRVLPHVGDAYAAGLLTTLPRGTRDVTQAGALVRAGRDAALRWPGLVGLTAAPALRAG